MCSLRLLVAILGKGSKDLKIYIKEYDSCLAASEIVKYLTEISKEKSEDSCIITAKAYTLCQFDQK